MIAADVSPTASGASQQQACQTWFTEKRVVLNRLWARRLTISSSNIKAPVLETKKKRGRRRPTLPRNRLRSTIGAGELNDRVRDGYGCGLPAIAAAPRDVARIFFRIGVWGSGSSPDMLCPGFLVLVRCPASFFGKRLVKPHGLLVPVSSTHYCAYTPGLSTS